MSEGMKDSGIKWIGAIPENWETNRIRGVLTFCKGLSITKEDLTDEGIAVVSYGQVHSRENSGTSLQDSLLRYVPESYVRKNLSSIVHKGDFVFADTSEDFAGVGNCIFNDREDLVYAGYHSIIARPINDSVYTKYLAYLFLTDVWRSSIRSKVMGVKVFSITNKLLREATVLLPPKDEQIAIVELLDTQCAELDSIIADLEKQIETLQKYKKSLITETVTKGLDRTVPMKDSGVEWIGQIPKQWSVKRLKYLGTARNGLTYEPADVDETETGTLVLRSTNIQDGELSLDDALYVDVSIPKEIVLQKDDILLCSRNGSRSLIGKCILIDDRTIGETYGAFMCVFRSNHNRFLHYVFLSELFNYYLPTFLTSTVNQLTNSNLYNMVVPITFSKEEQGSIVSFLDDKCDMIDEILSEKKKALNTAKSNKAAIIFEYVTGKKRVKGAI